MQRLCSTKETANARSHVLDSGLFYISCIVYLARIHVFTLFLLMCPDRLLLPFFS